MGNLIPKVQSKSEQNIERIPCQLLLGNSKDGLRE